MNSNEVFIHIHQGCFAGTGAIARLPQCQWSKPDGYGKISQCITTTKHSKAKTVCIFLGINCMLPGYDCTRLLHSPNLVAIELWVGYETWPPVGFCDWLVWIYRLGLPSAPLHYGLTWPVGIPNVFQTSVTVPLHSPNARFTPNRDELRIDLRVEKFWICWTRE